MSVFYTSDTHFGHGNTLHKEFCARPFQNVAGMNIAMIRRWNKVVQPGDTVYHLGDFAYEGLIPSAKADLLCRLNGIKHLIVGNHDDNFVIKLPWASVNGQLDVTTARGMLFRLSHYPPGNPRGGEIYLHGHLHKSSTRMPIYDVGVDANGFTPIPEHVLERAADAWMKGQCAFKSLVAGRVA